MAVGRLVDGNASIVDLADFCRRRYAIRSSSQAAIAMPAANIQDGSSWKASNKVQPTCVKDEQARVVGRSPDRSTFRFKG
jgi:hypothetical protein